MEKQVSSWFNVSNAPSNYVFPQEYRPGKLHIPICDTIPIIDLGTSSKIQTIQKMLEAAQEFGFFQVINHGISEHIISDTMEVSDEFFSLPDEEKANVNSSKNGWVYTSHKDYNKDGIHLWRDHNLKHPCHPLAESKQLWPEKPTRYREVVGAYLAEIRKLSLKILELISEGLGLDLGYFDEMSELQLLSRNNYPPCPDPSLTLGLLRHHDPSLITILYQDVSGLQVFKNGQWIGVGALPNAFLVNIGNQLEIISNGRLKSAEHRVVTNPSQVRRSIATFINPSPNCIIEPAKVLVNEVNPARYEPKLYKDFVYYAKAFGPHTHTMQGATP